MSEPSGFVSGQFYPRDPLQIILDYQVAASGVYEEINFGPGDPLYQLSKIINAREYQIELMIQAVVSGLSINTAYGEWLDKHGENKGIWRKGSQNAGGYVHLTFAPPDVGVNYDLLGTEYYTKTNVKFIRAQPTISQRIEHYIPIQRGYGSRDALPAPFLWISATGYIDSGPLGSGTYSYTPEWNSTYQYLDWDGVADISTGDTYYVEIVTSVRVQDDIASVENGTGSNVGANSVVRWVNTQLPASASVNNPYSLTGGADEEPDDDYRERLLRAVNRTFTMPNIRTIAEGIQGVRSAHVYQAIGTDKTSVSGTWSTTTQDYISGIYITGIYSGDHDVVSGAVWSQQYTPTNDILGLKRVVFRGERIGYPPPLVVGLRNANSEVYLTSGIFDTFDVIPPASTGQDIEVNITYLDLDYTENYRFEFWCRDKTGAVGTTYWDENYWLLYTGAMSGTLGDGDEFTGLLSDPTGNSHDANLIFKTQYGSAAFNVDLAVKDGYTFSELQSTLDEQLDWVEGSGYAPIGVNYSINEASKVLCYYKGTVYVRKDAISPFNTIKGRIDNSIETYLESLEPGENVVYSEVYYRIMTDIDIWRIDDLRIYESGESYLEDEDINIKDREVAVFIGSTLNQG